MENVTSEKKRRIAYHEAGHAIIGHLLGMLVEKIVVDPEHEKQGGFVDFKDAPNNIYQEDGRLKDGPLKREDLFAWLLINYAGYRAEQLVFGWTTGEAVLDTERIIKIDDRLTEMDGKGKRESGKYRDQAIPEADGMLKLHTSVLNELAKRALQQKHISDTEFLAIMKGFGL